MWCSCRLYNEDPQRQPCGLFSENDHILLTLISILRVCTSNGANTGRDSCRRGHERSFHNQWNLTTSRNNHSWHKVGGYQAKLLSALRLKRLPMGAKGSHRLTPTVTSPKPFTVRRQCPQLWLHHQNGRADHRHVQLPWIIQAQRLLRLFWWNVMPVVFFKRFIWFW